ncbi:hypothetical protein [uncultured Thiodictyon sp.]|uniref:hypothetical protein n=1 Tax=uncultured Thiodictyon sp. TaxID=1846217 RepID=UPI0025DA5BA4|nr:hypothetical protein [uncultured Thiodictyon sp.]
MHRFSDYDYDNDNDNDNDNETTTTIVFNLFSIRYSTPEAMQARWKPFTASSSTVKRSPG